MTTTNNYIDEEELIRAEIDARAQANKERNRKLAVAKAVPFIAKWEGFREKKYLDQAGIWTIGYGFTDKAILAKYENTPMTKEEGMELIKLHVDKLSKQIELLVERTLNSNQLAALYSLAYNIGIGRFSTSTLLKVLNKKPHSPEVDKQFRVWRYVSGMVSSGLVNRRNDEVKLYHSTEELNNA
ncbi:hypothetical protein CKF54_00950 [Psittacicella hinzii]|uniref:Lysozyme n=1 Tax=Psittacicella hinzii TaxID=2028575 RepID=A0A3A1Y9X2_9GAMM|nr:lysozyme [Psittacicella hinzii]RIY34341.1 hypothetical protein CKF54_00950 [Psittacicella hinzii]